MSEPRQNSSVLSKEEVAAILRLPWRPFMSMTEARTEAVDRAIHSPDLYAYHMFPGPKGPQEWPEDRIQHAIKLLHAEGHFFSIHLHGGIDSILQVLRKWLPTWKVLEPDWIALERVLVDECQVDPLQLPNLTLIDIRRVLSSQPQSRSGTKTSTRKNKSSRLRNSPQLTTREAQVYNLVRSQSLTYEAIAKQLGITKQRVGALYKRAQERMDAALAQALQRSKSVRAYTGLDMHREIADQETDD